MGSFFTNVSFIPRGDCREAVSSAMAKLGYRPAESGTELLLLPQNGRWCTVHSDFINHERLHDALSDCAEAVLTVACFDSDFLALTLTREGRTETVCVCEPYEEDMFEIQLTPGHWQPVVGDVEAFRSLLDESVNDVERFVFAEESLEPLGSLMGFDPAQINATPDELLDEPSEDMIPLHFEKGGLDSLQSALLKSIPEIDVENKTVPAELTDALDKLTKLLFP